jgi:hypothetical protein
MALAAETLLLNRDLQALPPSAGLLVAVLLSVLTALWCARLNAVEGSWAVLEYRSVQS